MLLFNGSAADEAGIAEWFERELGIDVTPDRQHIVKIYDYVDEQGALLFQVLRWGPKKTFSQQQPGTGKGGIKRGADGKPTMQGARYVPYHLDTLVAAAAKKNGKRWRVYIVEGEKDADRLVAQWGVTATTNAGGAGKWRKEYGRYFTGAEVIVLADNDKAGREHATAVVAALSPFAAVVNSVELTGLPDKGDISDWIDAGGTQSDLEDLVDGAPSYQPDTDDDDAAPLVPSGQPEVKSAGRYRPIAPREWLLGTNFCRGFLSGLTGAGATGKTAIRLLQCIALALGLGYLVGEHVFRRTKVLIVGLEDDGDEMERRIQAACLYHRLDQSALDGWLYYWTPRDLRLLEVDQHGHAAPGELGDALRRIIKQLGIGLVTVDPFVKSHGAEENDNSLIDRAASLFLQVAHDCGCACDYVHHHRKGITIAGDPDSVRGAGALVNASRLVKTATKMSEQEAKDLSVSAVNRKLLVRLDDAKLNIAPPATETVWFRLVGVDIGNPSEDYPNGDNVQTVERWYPPAPAQGIAKSTIAEIFDMLREGPEPGEFYLSDPRANGAWAGSPIAKIGDMERGEAKRLLADWIKNGVLVEGEYYSKKRHSTRTGVTLVETKAALILGSLYRPPGTGK